MGRQINIKALVSHLIKGDGTDKCRICLNETSEGQVHLGDTVMMDGEKSITLGNLLEDLTGIEISEETQCPLGVCVTCANAAISAEQFRVLVNQSQNLWAKAVENLDVTVYAENATKHKSMCVIVKKNLDIESVTFSIIDKKNGLSKSKDNVLRKRKKVKSCRSGCSCKCPDCGKSFQSAYFLNQHLFNSGQKEVCLICGDVIIRGKEMVEHLANVHQRQSFLCAECPNVYKSEANLERHMQEAHRPDALTCCHCGRSFPRQSSFDAHSQMHTVRTCRTCGMQFNNRGCYREHRSKCEPTAKPDKRNIPKSKRSNIRDLATFICDYCSKTYNSRAQLKNHIIWIHMGIRPYQCQFCGKRFYTRARLAEHNIVHTRERKFACDICGVKLVSKMAVVYHRRRHTGERPYECCECGERFISSSRRSEHTKRRHRIGRVIKCVECSANFVRSVELRKHILKVHSQDPINF